MIADRTVWSSDPLLLTGEASRLPVRQSCLVFQHSSSWLMKSSRGGHDRTTNCLVFRSSESSKIVDFWRNLEVNPLRFKSWGPHSGHHRSVCQVCFLKISVQNRTFLGVPVVFKNPLVIQISQNHHFFHVFFDRIPVFKKWHTEWHARKSACHPTSSDLRAHAETAVYTL